MQKQSVFNGRLGAARPVLVTIVLVGAVVIASALWYRTTTPEYAVGCVQKTLAHGDLRHCRHRITATGESVITYALKSTPQVAGKEPQRIASRRIGNEYYVRTEMQGDNGIHVADALFVRESGRWQFHDVMVVLVDGRNVNLAASYMIQNPLRTKAIIVWRNPDIAIPWLIRGALLIRSLHAATP